jgi:hypothetical protein
MSRTAEWMLRYATGESDFSMLADRRSAANTPVGQKSLDRKPRELKPVAFTNADIARLDARRRNGDATFLTHQENCQRVCLHCFNSIIADCAGPSLTIKKATSSFSLKKQYHKCFRPSTKKILLFSAESQSERWRQVGDRQDQPTFDCRITVDGELQKLSVGKSDRIAVVGAELA